MASANILIIDDEYNIRTMLRLALTHVGYTAETAGDGYEGLERFGPDGAGWDLVLLDQRMPGMEGLEVLREMRRRRSDTRVILITAFGTIDLATDAMQAGARDFLRKPFTVEVLRSAVEAILSNHPAPMVRPALSMPLSFEMTSVNGFRISSAPGIRAERDGGVRDDFVIRDPVGGERRCEVVLPSYVVELVKAHADRDTLPGGDAFWQSLCGEALANHLWQNAEPPDGTLTVDDLTSGLRHWIDAVLQATSSGDAMTPSGR